MKPQPVKESPLKSSKGSEYELWQVDENLRDKSLRDAQRSHRLNTDSIRFQRSILTNSSRVQSTEELNAQDNIMFDMLTSPKKKLVGKTPGFGLEAMTTDRKAKPSTGKISQMSETRVE